MLCGLRVFQMGSRADTWLGEIALRQGCSLVGRK